MQEWKSPDTSASQRTMAAVVLGRLLGANRQSAVTPREILHTSLFGNSLMHCSPFQDTKSASRTKAIVQSRLSTHFCQTLHTCQRCLMRTDTLRSKLDVQTIQRYQTFRAIVQKGQRARKLNARWFPAYRRRKLTVTTAAAAQNMRQHCFPAFKTMVLALLFSLNTTWQCDIRQLQPSAFCL